MVYIELNVKKQLSSLEDNPTTMKAVAVFVALFAYSLAGPVPDQTNSDIDNGANRRYFLFEKKDGTIQVEDLVNSTIEARASESDITFYFYSRSNPINGVAFKSNQLSALETTAFNPKRNTVVLVHGWINDFQSEVNTVITAALLNKVDVNIIVVDWSPMAKKNYITAKNAVTSVGSFVGAVLQTLVSQYKLSWSSFKLVGHSLGAHIIGNAGAACDGQIGTLIGLDPALPLFSIENTDNRIDPTDGQFVHIIHTSGGLLGFKTPIGDADYYPNGGSSQPGCGLDIAGSCAHSRAYFYYAESLLHDAFISRICDSYSNYNNGRCISNPSSKLGGCNIDNRASGNYYLHTNAQSPYATAD